MATKQPCCSKSLAVSPAVDSPLKKLPATEKLLVELPFSNSDSLDSLNDSFELLSISDSDDEDEKSNDSFDFVYGINYYLKNYTKSYKTKMTAIYDDETELNYGGDDLFETTNKYEEKDKIEQEKYKRCFDRSQPSCSYTIETCCSFTSTSLKEVDYCHEERISDIKRKKTGIPLWDNRFINEQVKNGHKKVTAKRLNKYRHPAYHTYKCHTKTIVMCDTEESIECSNAVKFDVENTQGFVRFVLEDLPNLSFDEDEDWAEISEKLKMHEEWEKRKKEIKCVDDKTNIVEGKKRSLQSFQDQRPKVLRRRTIPVCQSNIKKFDRTQSGKKISAGKLKVENTDVSPTKNTRKVIVRKKVIPTESEVWISKRTTNRKKVEETIGKQQKFKSKIVKASSSGLVVKSSLIKQNRSSLISSTHAKKEIDVESKRRIAQKSMSENAKVNIEQLTQGIKKRSVIEKKANLIKIVELKSASRGKRSKYSKISAVQNSELIKSMRKCKSVSEKKVSVAKSNTTIEKEELQQIRKKSFAVKSVQSKMNHKLQNHEMKISKPSSSRSESVLVNQKKLCYFNSSSAEQESHLKKCKLAKESTAKKLTSEVSKINGETAICKEDKIFIRKNPNNVKYGVSNIKNTTKPKISAKKPLIILKRDKFDEKRKTANLEKIDSTSMTKSVRQMTTSFVDINYGNVSKYRKESNFPVSTTQKPKLKIKKIGMRLPENLNRNVKSTKSSVPANKQEGNKKVVKKKISPVGYDIIECNKLFNQMKPASVNRKVNHAKFEVPIPKQKPKNIQTILAMKNKPERFNKFDGAMFPSQHESVYNVTSKKVSYKCKVSTTKKIYKKKNIKEIAHTVTSVSKANDSISHIATPSISNNNLVADFGPEKPYIERAKAKRRRSEI